MDGRVYPAVPAPSRLPARSRPRAPSRPEGKDECDLPFFFPPAPSSRKEAAASPLPRTAPPFTFLPNGHAKHMGCHLGRAPKRCPHPTSPRPVPAGAHPSPTTTHLMACICPGSAVGWEGRRRRRRRRHRAQRFSFLGDGCRPAAAVSERASKRERPVAGRGWRRRRRDGDRAGVRGLLPTTPRSPERERRRARRATPPSPLPPPPGSRRLSLSRLLKRPELGSPPPTAGILATGAHAGPSPLS